MQQSLVHKFFLTSLSCKVPSVFLKNSTEINDPQVRCAGAIAPGRLDMRSKYEQEASLFRYEEAHHLLPQRSLGASTAPASTGFPVFRLIRLKLTFSLSDEAG
jgi:hypothetical protein